MSDGPGSTSRREPMMHDATSTPPRWMERSLAQLTFVRFKEFLREPEAVFWTFAFPVILALGLGIAFRNKPADVLVIGVVGGTPAGDSIAATLTAASGFRVRVMPEDLAARALRTGEVALVAAPSGAGRVEYRFDDTRPEGRSARTAADDALQRAAGRRDPVTVSEAHVRDKGSRYIDFVVPGLLGMNIMGGGIWGLGFAIVEARRKNLLKRLVSTPMRRAHYLASFLFSRFVFLILEVAVLIGSAALFFDVPVRGSLLQLLVICLLAALAFGGIGLLIASRARTIEGVSGLMNLAMMPMWVLSGVFFSSANFPQAAQPFIKALPLTATNDALRATMLQGAAFTAVLPQIGVIVAWLVVTFTLALRLFRWR
jgi:ABC-2 type transport system permease protein